MRGMDVMRVKAAKSLMDSPGAVKPVMMGYHVGNPMRKTYHTWATWAWLIQPINLCDFGDDLLLGLPQLVADDHGIIMGKLGVPLRETMHSRIASG